MVWRIRCLSNRKWHCQ